MRLDAVPIEVTTFQFLSRLTGVSFHSIFRFVAIAAAVALVSFFYLPSVHARTPEPTNVPLERLLANAEAFIARNPKDAEGYYIVGRIHHLAFLRGRETLPVAGGEPDDSRKVPALPQDPLHSSGFLTQRSSEANRRAATVLGWTEKEVLELVSRPEIWYSKRAKQFFQESDKQSKKLEQEEWVSGATLDWEVRLDHAGKTVKNFREAMRLDTKGCLIPLGLASFAEDLERTLRREKITKLPPTLGRFSAKEIRDLYGRAFTLAAPPDHDWQKLADRMQAGESINFRSEDYTVYHEAGQAFVRVATREGVRLSEEEQKFLRIVKSGLAKRQEFDKRRRPDLISPIIFSMAPVAEIACLLAPEASVGFDLSGYEGDRRWSWVQPTTCFLVWDPQHTGQITSARQMFGTYTFGIPWQNGYRALAALDDNADGELSGSELRGMAVWTDRNGDAVSQPGEVAAVEEVGLTAVMVHEEAYDGIHPMHPCGITL